MKYSRHGMSNTRFYRIWHLMKTRCSLESATGYKNYGGRGIKVCERWDIFSNFYDDMFSSYKENLSLDRINNDCDYSPKNCRWATRREQHRNMRSNRWYEHGGKKKILADWSKISNIKDATFRQRLTKLGWSLEKALTTTLNSPTTTHQRDEIKHYYDAGFTQKETAKKYGKNQSTISRILKYENSKNKATQAK